MEGVAVAGKYHRVHALLLRTPRQCPYQVVGLVAVKLEHRNSEGRHQLLDPAELSPQFLRGRLPLRLVRLEPLVAEGGRMGVEGYGAVAGLPVLQRLQEDVDEPVDPGNILAGG